MTDWDGNGKTLSMTDCDGNGKALSMTVDIKKGDRYLCVCNVVMNDTNELAYIKGRVYTSELDGCLTDEEGIVKHWWCGCTIFADHFKLCTDDMIPVLLTAEQWEVVMKELDSWKEEKTTELRELYANHSGYIVLGCSEESYQKFVERHKKAVQKAVMLCNDLERQVRRYNVKSEK